MSQTNSPPDIEPRFQPPEGWRWHGFERIKGRKIRFGSVFPQDSIPDAVMVCLQGVREFSEKYYEMAHWCLDNNMAFWICDWAGQGKSTRFLPNRQKRHSQGFDADIDDLHYFIMEYIKHSSVHPDKGRIPMAMLAHSMGANIGLRYIAKHPDIFECAGLTSPMIGIKAFSKIPQSLALMATKTCSTIMGSSYIPAGGDWKKGSGYARLTSDTIRAEIYDRWYEFDSELQCGDVTYGWVHEAQLSCLNLKKEILDNDIQTHCLFALAGKEDLVDNKIANKVIGHLPNAKVIEYPNSFHEILMEKDEIRDNFLKHFYDLVKERIIDRPETLKPF